MSPKKRPGNQSRRRPCSSHKAIYTSPLRYSSTRAGAGHPSMSAAMEMMPVAITIAKYAGESSRVTSLRKATEHSLAVIRYCANTGR